MSRFYSYLNSAKKILLIYNGEEPFASYLKKYFAADKKFGSKDRKQISHLCYCYFRLGKAALDLPVEERILISLFLCSHESNEVLKNLRPEWFEKVSVSLEEKLSILNFPFSINEVFPWKEDLSDGIDFEKFNESFFIQPDLFIRIRPGNEKSVHSKLTKAGISFNQLTEVCIALPNSTKVEDVIELNKEAVIQDYNSQQAGELLKLAVDSSLPITIGMAVWDCCAGSGGKSIMAKDILGDIGLTVSDMRESILVNLRKRFKEAGIKNYESFTADLTHSPFTIHHSSFDLTIADIPCTGSGTWSRTPEQLFYFEKEKIEEYAKKQKKIVSNVIPHLKPGGHFLYITCSVFKKENEEIIEFIKQEFDLKIIKMEVLKGYDKKADTMFAALLEKAL